MKFLAVFGIQNRSPLAAMRVGTREIRETHHQSLFRLSEFRPSYVHLNFVDLRLLSSLQPHIVIVDVGEGRDDCSPRIPGVTISGSSCWRFGIQTQAWHLLLDLTKAISWCSNPGAFASKIMYAKVCLPGRQHSLRRCRFMRTPRSICAAGVTIIKVIGCSLRRTS